MSRIGEQIRQARNEQKLTQKQLAQKVGVAEKYIKEVEAGTKIINQDILDKIIRAVDAPINDSVVFENYNEIPNEKVEIPKINKIAKIEKQVKDTEPEIQDIWSNALGSVLADIPIFDYSLTNSLNSIKLPVINKKVDGYPLDKILYIKIADDDMIGFRICKNDLAFCINSHEFVDNSICLLDYKKTRIIRMIKNLDNNNALLISNKSLVKTETVSMKDINILVRLLKIEFIV